MKGLKSKILIVLLVAVAMIMGYQLVSQAQIGKRYYNPGAVWAPVHSAGIELYCREHNVSFMNTPYWECKHERDLKANNDYGIAFLFNYGSKGRWGDRQYWAWYQSGSVAGSYTIGYNTDYEKMFDTNSDLGLKLVETTNNIPEGISVMETDYDRLWNDPTFYMIDEMPEAFDSADVSIEEYRYIYELQDLFKYMSDRKAKGLETTVEDLNEYIKDSGIVDNIMAPVYGENVKASELGQRQEKTDYFGNTYYIFNKDGNALFSYDYNYNSGDDTYQYVYYLDSENSNIIKFGNEIYLGEKTEITQEQLARVYMQNIAQWTIDFIWAGDANIHDSRAITISNETISYLKNNWGFTDDDLADIKELRELLKQFDENYKPEKYNPASSQYNPESLIIDPELNIDVILNTLHEFNENKRIAKENDPSVRENQYTLKAEDNLKDILQVQDMDDVVEVAIKLFEDPTWQMGVRGYTYYRTYGHNQENQVNQMFNANVVSGNRTLWGVNPCIDCLKRTDMDSKTKIETVIANHYELYTLAKQRSMLLQDLVLYVNRTSAEEQKAIYEGVENVEYKEKLANETLQLYIDLFNGTANRSQLIARLSQYVKYVNNEKVHVYEKLSIVLTGKDINYNNLKAIYDEYNTKMHDCLKNIENKTGFDINGGEKKYIASGSAYNMAKVYQKIMTGGFFEKWKNEFSIVGNNNIAIDSENDNYIIGPLTMNYVTVQLSVNGYQKNPITIFGIGDDYSIKCGDKDIDASLLFNSQSSGKKLPGSGEPFYIVINASNGFRLKENDNITFTVESKRLELESGMLYFLYGASDPDNSSQNITGYNGVTGYESWSSSTPQRLWTGEASFKEVTEPMTWQGNAGNVDITLIKEKAEKQPDGTIKLTDRLQGAKFTAVAVYTKSGDNTEYYFSPGNLFETEVDENGDPVVEDGAVKSKLALLGNSNDYPEMGKFLDETVSKMKNTGKSSELYLWTTNEKGEIYFGDIPVNAAIGTEFYTFKKLVVKEIQAPDGYETKTLAVKDGSVVDYSENGCEIIYNSDKDEIRQEFGNEEIVPKPYEIKIKKVDDSKNPIPGIAFDYTIYRIENPGQDDGIAVLRENDTVLTDENGIATIPGEENADCLLLQIKENKEKSTADTSKYRMFKEILLYYSAKTSSNKETADVTPLSKADMTPDSDGPDFKNGIYYLRTDKDEKLYGEEAEQYIKYNADRNEYDYEIINDEEKTYSLELLKYDEFGNNTSALDGTMFNVIVACKKMDNGLLKSAGIPNQVVKDGKITISDLDLYGDEITVSLQEIKTIEGYKTSLEKMTPVLTYSMHQNKKEGKIHVEGTIDANKIDAAKLDPKGILAEKKIDIAKIEPESDSAKVTLNLGVVNNAAEYSLKFRKTDENGNPLTGVIFELRDEKGNYIDQAEATEENNGYMQFNGLTKTSKDIDDKIEVQLVEVSTAQGFEFEDKPYIINYVYRPSEKEKATDSETNEEIEMNKLVVKSITHNGEVIKGEKKLLSDDLVFNFSKKEGTDANEGTEFFSIPNNAKPYNVEFTKIDDKTKEPIDGIKFKASIVAIKEASNDDGSIKLEYAKFEKANEEKVGQDIKEVEVTSKNGIVSIPNVADYRHTLYLNYETGKIVEETGTEKAGHYYLVLDEISDENNNYQMIDKTFVLEYSIKPGDAGITWGNNAIVLKESGLKQTIEEAINNNSGIKLQDINNNVVKYSKDENGTIKIPTIKENHYTNITIQDNKLFIENSKQPYSIKIVKTDSLGNAMKNVEFEAYVLKNLTSEKTPVYRGVTNEHGEIILEGIDIYSTPEEIEENRERLSLIINETLPEGHEWYNFDKVTHSVEYEIDFKKFSANESLSPMTKASVTGNLRDEEGNSIGIITLKYIDADKFISDKDAEVTVNIENVITYDLSMDKKLRTADGDKPIKDGIEFTGKIEDIDVTVEFANGVITAKDIKVTDETKNTVIGDNRKLVLKETNTSGSGLKEIAPITIIYNAELVDDANGNKIVKTTITGFEYNGTTYPAAESGTIIEDLIEAQDGKYTLINKPISTDLKLRKVRKVVQEDGTVKLVPVDGIIFKGKVINEDNNATKSFNVETIDGKAVIEDIITSDSFTGNNIKIVIESEEWAPNAEHEFELEFMKNITISGVQIYTEGTSNELYINFSNAVVDDAHKDQISFNNGTAEVIVENKTITYSYDLIKTNNLYSKVEQPVKLQGIKFNFYLRDTNQDDNEAQKIENNETSSDGTITLPKMEKMGDQVLIIEEVSGPELEHRNALEGKAYIQYNVKVDENGNVIKTLTDITYANPEDDGKVEAVRKVVDEKGNETYKKAENTETFDDINVANTDEYDVTLHKVVRINGDIHEVEDDDSVSFKGILTTDKTLVINDKLLTNMFDEDKENDITYEEFKDNISGTNFTNNSNVISFEGNTEDGELLIKDVALYGDVYAYFIEYNVPNTMESHEEVFGVQFSTTAGSTQKVNLTSDYLQQSKPNDSQDREITLINDAKPYEIQVIKIDEETGKPINTYAEGKFNFTLKEIVKENDKIGTKLSETITVSFDSDGRIIETEFGEFIVGAELKTKTDEEGNEYKYIALAINKYGELELQIDEKDAPKHYLDPNKVVTIAYTAEPGKLSNIKISGIKDEPYDVPDIYPDEETFELVLPFNLPNKAEPYDIDIYKVVEHGIDPTDIEFTIYMFDENYNRIMKDLDGSYKVANGTFRIEDIDTNKTFYIAIEEKYAPQGVHKLEGINVLKVTREFISEDSNERKTNIEYVGIASGYGEELKTLNTPDTTSELAKENKEHFEWNGEDQKLTIKNDAQKPYPLKLVKLDEDGNPLNGVEFDLYLTNQDDNPLQDSSANKLPEENSYKKAGTANTYVTKNDGEKDGMIDLGELSIYSEKEKDLKLTIVEHFPSIMKEEFEKIEVIYSADGKNLNIKEILIYDKDTKGPINGMEKNEVISVNADGQIELTIRNHKKDTVPLTIFKEYNKEGENKKIPLTGAEFSGYVVEVDENNNEKTNATRHPFKNIKDSDDGNVDGFYKIQDEHDEDFRVEGRIKVYIEETKAPTGFGKIPPTTIWIDLNEKYDGAGFKHEIDPETVDKDSSAFENAIVDWQGYQNIFELSDKPSTQSAIQLAGLVWIDQYNIAKQSENFNDGYTQYNENTDMIRNESTRIRGKGIYDAAYDARVEGVKVTIHYKNDSNAVVKDLNGNEFKTIKTDHNGQYSFEGLDPFEKYYVTFDCSEAKKAYYYKNPANMSQGENSIDFKVEDYETLQYLVYGFKDGFEPIYDTSFETINNHKRAIDRNQWKVNSKVNVTEDITNVISSKIEDGTFEGENCYPVFDYFVISGTASKTLYIDQEDPNKTYYITNPGGATEAKFEVLDDKNDHVNMGLIDKPKFDLKIEKDVQYVELILNNGSSMRYKYGKKLAKLDYQLPIKVEDAKNIKDINIVYKITVTNQASKGKLISISDYFDSTLMHFVGWTDEEPSIGTTEELTTSSIGEQTEFNKDGWTETSSIDIKMIPYQTSNGTEELAVNNPHNTGKIDIVLNKEFNEIDESANIYIKYTFNKDENGNTEMSNKDEGYAIRTMSLVEILASEGITGRNDIDSYAGNLQDKFNGEQTHSYTSWYDSANITRDDLPNGKWFMRLKESIKNNEDDEDYAPAFEWIITSGMDRTIEGTVFDDANSNGIMDNGENGIKGVKVKLINSDNTQVYGVQTTNEYGTYIFKDMPAGKYHVEFTYGDKDTVLPKIAAKDGVEGIENEMVIGDAKDPENHYTRNNFKSYNTFENYSDTIGTIDYTNNPFWYADKDTTRYSDAKDKDDDRTKVDDELDKDKIEVADGTKIGVMNNEKATMLYSYKSTAVNKKEVQDYVKKLAEFAVTASTPEFQVNIENITGSQAQYEGQDDYGKAVFTVDSDIIEAKGIDFGIKPKGTTDLQVKKEITNLKIWNSAGNLDVDVSFENGKVKGTASRVQWTKDGYDPLLKVERSDEEISRSTMKITYQITVTDKSGKVVNAVVADYVKSSDQLNFVPADNEGRGWTEVNARTISDNDNQKTVVGDIYIDPTIELSSMNGREEVSNFKVITNTLQLADKDGVREGTTEITLTKTLNSHDETNVDEYLNYVEVIQVQMEGLPEKDIDSIPGTLDPNFVTTENGINYGTTVGVLGSIPTSAGNNVKTVTVEQGKQRYVIGALEKDSARSVERLVISPETGENRDNTYYILTLAVVSIIAVGVILIKKFAIRD